MREEMGEWLEMNFFPLFFSPNLRGKMGEWKNGRKNEKNGRGLVMVLYLHVRGWQRIRYKLRDSLSYLYLKITFIPIFIFNTQRVLNIATKFKISQVSDILSIPITRILALVVLLCSQWQKIETLDFEPQNPQ